MIELRHLRAFRALMQHGSTVTAAKALGVSQPSVSRLLAELEESYGDALFTRANGRLIARASAESLLPEIDSLLSGVEELTGGRQRAGTPFSVAAPNGIVTRLFAPALKAMQADYPDLRVTADIMSYYDTVNAVAMGRADCGLVKAPVEHPAVRAAPLITVGTEVLMPRDHPLVRRDRIVPADLVGEPLILLGRNRPFRVDLDQAFEAAGIAPRVTAETQAVAAACALVRQGLGLTVANSLLAKAEAAPDLIARPFAVGLQHSFCLVRGRRTARPHLIDRFAAHLDRVIAGIVGPETEPPAR